VRALVTMLVRAAIEDEQTMRHTMEKVVRAIGHTRAQSAQNRVRSRCCIVTDVVQMHRWDSHTRGRYRADFQQSLRTLAPVMCREPIMFHELAQRVLQVDLGRA